MKKNSLKLAYIIDSTEGTDAGKVLYSFVGTDAVERAREYVRQYVLSHPGSFIDIATLKLRTHTRPAEVEEIEYDE